MLLIQFTGLSGAGKTSIANAAKSWMAEHCKHFDVEVIDADYYRKTLNKDLGFSKADRLENIRRLGNIAAGYVAKGYVIIIAAINPYEVARAELRTLHHAKTVWIDCDLNELIRRDTKGLYRRALTTPKNEQTINNLTGINDPYEPPENADLIINTADENLDASVARLVNFIVQQLSIQS